MTAACAGVMAARRALHFVFKVGNRFQTARFYRDVLGMKVQAGFDWGWRARRERAPEPALAEGGEDGCVVNLRRRVPDLRPGAEFSFRSGELPVGIIGLGEGPNAISPRGVPSTSFRLSHS